MARNPRRDEPVTDSQFPAADAYHDEHEFGEDGFDLWIDTLEIDVIQFGFGYEPGEFTVYPDHWRAAYDEGLTPAQAWQRALDAFGEARREEDAARAANWARIQEDDRRAIEAQRGAS